MSIICLFVKIFFLTHPPKNDMDLPFLFLLCSDVVSKVASVLKWCQSSMPDDIQLIHFEKSVGKSVQVDRMTFDVAEIEK